MHATETNTPTIASVELIIGLEVHVELATQSKMFSRAPSPAASLVGDHAPNSLIDPTVFALPGPTHEVKLALPVLIEGLASQTDPRNLVEAIAIPLRATLPHQHHNH